MLSGNGQYDSIVKDALSTSGSPRPDKQDRTANLRREIGEKSSLDALVRLTGDKTFPMDKNFLVGAGNRVMTEDVGWTTRAGGRQSNSNQAGRFPRARLSYFRFKTNK